MNGMQQTRPDARAQLRGMCTHSASRPHETSMERFHGSLPCVTRNASAAGALHLHICQARMRSSASETTRCVWKPNSTARKPSHVYHRHGALPRTAPSTCYQSMTHRIPYLTTNLATYPPLITRNPLASRHQTPIRHPVPHTDPRQLPLTELPATAIHTQDQPNTLYYYYLPTYYPYY